jgi:hypothetical protein
MTKEEAQHMNDRELFLKALDNAIAWQNRCVDLYEIIEMLCLDAEVKLKDKSTREQK